MDLLNEQFGKRLKYIRQASKLTQKDLASKTNISPQVISNLERGYTKTIGHDDLKKIALVLNCKVGDLMQDADSHSISNISEIELLDYLNNIIGLIDNYGNLHFNNKRPSDETKDIVKSMIKGVIEVIEIKSRP